MSVETARRWGSALDSVVVYARGALCRRLARGGVPRDGRVRVTGLPRTLDPGSLRVRVLGADGVRVTEARVEVGSEPRDGSAPDALRHEVERLGEAYAAVEARRDRQRGLIEEVRGLHPVPPARKREDPPRPAPVDAWLELADFVDERLTGLHSRLVELDEELLRVGHALDVVSDRLRRASTDAPAAHVETTVSAALVLDGAAGDEVELELEYGVPGAVWVPAYRLFHRRGDDDGRLVLRASVAQRTGEDWTGVRVALATADLERRTDLPRLRSMRIGRRQEAPAPSGWREPPAGLAGLFAGYEAAGPRPVPAGGAGAGGFGRGGAVAAGVAEEFGGAGAGSAGGFGGAGVGSAGGFDGAVTGLPAGFDDTLAGSAPPPFAPGPVPPPPPAPFPAVAPPSFAGSPPAAGAPPAPGGAYGFAPEVHGGAEDVERSAPPAAFARRRAMKPAAPGAAAPPAAGASGPPRPSGAELDYASLVLSGPDDQGPRRGLLFPGTSFDAVAAEYRRRAEGVAALPLPEYAVRPRESAGSFDHRFDAAARSDVPSDGTWHTVTVGEIPVGLRTEYLCVPSVEETVYATLLVSNATDRALLAGPVEVTVDGEFLLTAALPTLAPGAVRRLGLGAAEALRVTRRTQLRESTAGLRNNVTVLDHRVHVELANRLASPATVEVRERVPVTSEADVRIEERADWAVPEDGPEEHAAGTRVWRVELPAGATAALEGGYEIRIPAGKALVDGNRRS